ncbi:class I SAM-dependent methyltransferase [Streptomyces sp. NPDC006235]|uniref:class I SAM-dependent methyltransferase n=1 Tax=Streptomyces sp. NPDC006235 TaxID=3156736 RepID=UPI0033A09758
MPAEDTNTRAWQIYGQRQLARAHAPPIPDQLGWTPWEGIGPGAEVLGDIASRRVLDIGSGAGHHAVHLAQAHGARVTGIELSRPSTNAPSPPTGTLTAYAGQQEQISVWKARADIGRPLAQTARPAPVLGAPQAVRQQQVARRTATTVQETSRGVSTQPSATPSPTKTHRPLCGHDLGSVTACVLASS